MGWGVPRLDGSCVCVQEANCVGMKAALSDGDSVITAYRCHGWTYMMGSAAKEVGRCSCPWTPPKCCAQRPVHNMSEL